MTVAIGAHDLVRGHDIPAGDHETIKGLILTVVETGAVSALIADGLMVAWTSNDNDHPFLVSEASVDLVFHHGGVR